MQQGDWRRYAYVSAICAVATLIALVLGLQIGLGVGRYGSEADSYAGKARKYAEEQMGNCRLKPASAFEECISNAVEAGRENQTSEYDLAAQQEMATWAKWMFIGTAFQVIVGAIGLAALLETINQGRAANQIATDAIEAGQRAWLSVKIVSEPRIDLYGTEPSLRLRIKIENFGGSPARDISYVVDICIGYLPSHDFRQEIETHRKRASLLEESIFQKDFIEKNVRVVHTGETGPDQRVHIVIAVLYRTAFSDETRMTAHFFDVIDTDRSDALIDTRQPLPPERMMLLTHQLPSIIS